jgi:hypothetical protein
MALKVPKQAISAPLASSRSSASRAQNPSQRAPGDIGRAHAQPTAESLYDWTRWAALLYALTNVSPAVRPTARQALRMLHSINRDFSACRSERRKSQARYGQA